jgi:hypothetical protein
MSQVVLHFRDGLVHLHQQRLLLLDDGTLLSDLNHGTVQLVAKRSDARVTGVYQLLTATHELCG